MAEQKISAAQVKALQQAIMAYEQNPDMFSDEDVAGIKEMADAIGIPFEPKFSLGRTLGNAAFNFIDTLAFGVIPDEWGPAQLTGSDKVAATVGTIGGMVVPFGGPAKLAQKVLGKSAEAVPALQKIAKGEGLGQVFSKAPSGSVLEKVNKLLNEASKREAVRKAVEAALKSKATERAFRYGLEAGSRVAASELAEDPFGAPGDFIGGGILGAGFSAAAPWLATRFPSTMRMIDESLVAR